MVPYKGLTLSHGGVLILVQPVHLYREFRVANSEEFSSSH